MDGVNQHGLKEKESTGKSLGCSLEWFQEKLVFFALVKSCHSSPWGGGGVGAGLQSQGRGGEPAELGALGSDPRKQRAAALCPGLPGAIRTVWTQRAPAGKWSGLVVDLEEKT